VTGANQEPLGQQQMDGGNPTGLVQGRIGNALGNGGIQVTPPHTFMSAAEVRTGN
jgi:hypothetical protein